MVDEKKKTPVKNGCAQENFRERAPGGGGPLGAVLFLFTEPGPKDRDQPGQGAAQAVRAIGDAVEGERQSEDE